MDEIINLSARGFLGSRGMNSFGIFFSIVCREMEWGKD
jgi:hypothetical protein